MRFGLFATALLISLALISAPPYVHSQEPKIGRRALPFVTLDRLPEVDGPVDFEAFNKKGAGEIDIESFDAINALCGPKAIWQEVELYDGKLGPTIEFVSVRQPAVGQIQWREDLKELFNQPNDDAGNVAGARWCSGTLISKNLLLTAAHCFQVHTLIPGIPGWQTPRRRPAAAGGAKIIVQPPELATLMRVNFNYQIDATTKKIRNASSFPITRLVEYGFGDNTKQLDYAIVELGVDSSGKQAGDLYTMAQLDASDVGLSTAKSLTLIQHPNGMPKKIAAGPKAGISGDVIFYRNLDTLGGSSGSGILSDSGTLIGVHTNGGCDSVGTNRGVTLKSVKGLSKIVK